MHPWLLLLGSAGVTYAETLGHTWLAGAVAVAGGLLQALAKRSRIPMLRSLPKFAPAGSGISIALSVLFLLAGAVLIGTPIASTSHLGTAGHVFLPVIGSGLLFMFDTNDLAGVSPVPPSAAAFLVAVTLPFACAHVVPVTNCLEGKVGNQGPAIIAEIENDIQQQNWDDLLLALGPQLGWDVLACALDELESNKNPVVAARAKTFETVHAKQLHGGT
jgi:hypothetical protein